MKTLYQSILDDDDKVTKDIDYRSVIGRVNTFVAHALGASTIKYITDEDKAWIQTLGPIWKPRDKYVLRSVMTNISKYVNPNFDMSWVDTSEMTNMTELIAYYYRTNSDIFNLNISRWDVSNVQDMGSMFAGVNFGPDVDLSRWNTENVRDMYHMFYDSNFEGDIHKWNCKKVKWNQGMFSKCPIPYKNKPKFNEKLISQYTAK